MTNESTNNPPERLRWLVVRTKSRQETLALENLERQAFECYLPRLQLRKRRRNKWVDVVEPLFPGYIFVHVDPDQTSITPIRSTLGVNGIVRFGNALVPIPDDVIQYLKLNEQPDTGLHRSDKPLFEKGDGVQIVDGPFTGLQGVYQMDKGEDRVMILIEILGRQSSVALKLDAVARLS